MPLSRSQSIVTAFLAILSCSSLLGQDSSYPPKGQLIPPANCLTVVPADNGGFSSCRSEEHDAWLTDVRHWRSERRIRIGYDGHRYEEPALKWTHTSFIQPQMMVQDRYFYDPVAGKYTVNRYLDDLEARYGGIDAVLIWPTYPNMGIDDRNQHDMIRSMPGGIPGVKQMIADFHRRGVKVLFPMMMWDQGTHDPGTPWPQAIAELMKEVDVDGINGDTQDGVPLAFAEAAEKVDHPLAFEPEGKPADEAIAWDVLTWGQYSGQFNFVPGVDRYRWLEARHMVNISDRWNRDKNDDLQYAFFNGEGWESWENIWGIWNGITPRDGEATRRVATLERGVSRFLNSAGWEPFFPMHFYGVYASRWPVGDQTVWTIVNRNEYDIAGRQMSIPIAAGARYFDLYHGVELQPERDGKEDVLTFSLESHGFGAILSTKGEPEAGMRTLMQRMQALTSKPLSDFPHEWQPLAQQIVEIAGIKAPSPSASGEMVRIPGGAYVYKVRGIEIEGKDDVGVDVQYPWENMPRRFHEHTLQVKPFFLDKYPVTNAQFKKFLSASHYQPKDNLNFLRDWRDGNFPTGWDKKPVTWVSQEDARAYAKWAGKRLPHEWEWQFAAQGTDGRIYPWGDDWRPSAVPVPDRDRRLRSPDDVDAHPSGASPFGVRDLVGNVWQWTDEYVDEHTRAAILRGGSYYQPQGSKWYFPQAYRNDQHGKLLLMAPGYDRAGALGFRCAADTE